MRKKFAFVVCIALMLSFALSLFTASAVSMQVDHYKYMNMYEDGYVMPDQAITRGELANCVFNLLESDDKKLYVITQATFSDVPADYVYAKQIYYLAYKGHLTGYEDGTFRPGQTLTRAEFATIMKRIKRLIETTNILKSADIDGHWAMGAINAVIVAGYMKGYPDGTFKPENTVTRAEVATTLNRIFERKPNFTNTIKDSSIVLAIQNGTIDPVEFKNQTFTDLPKNHWAYAAMMEACISHRVRWDRVANLEVWIKLLETYTFMGPVN